MIKISFDNSALDSEKIKDYEKYGFRRFCEDNKLQLVLSPILLEECMGLKIANNIVLTLQILFFLGCGKKNIIKGLDYFLSGTKDKDIENNGIFEPLEKYHDIINLVLSPAEEEVHEAKTSRQKEQEEAGIYYVDIATNKMIITNIDDCRNYIEYRNRDFKNFRDHRAMIDGVKSSSTPFYDRFIEGCYYHFWAHVAKKEFPKKDKNYKRDLGYVPYLLFVDIFVTNDRFQKEMLENIYPEKRIMFPGEFIQELQMLNSK